MISATVIPRRENLNVVSVHQIEGDAIVVCYEGTLILSLFGQFD